MALLSFPPILVLPFAVSGSRHWGTLNSKLAILAAELQSILTKGLHTEPSLRFFPKCVNLHQTIISDKIWDLSSNKYWRVRDESLSLGLHQNPHTGHSFLCANSGYHPVVNSTRVLVRWGPFLGLKSINKPLCLWDLQADHNIDKVRSLVPTDNVDTSSRRKGRSVFDLQ